MKNSVKIALIEDEAAIRRVIALALRTAGYADVAEADDGRAGCELVERERPHLVLLDVMLPGMDGIEVCRRIRSSPVVGGTPIIMITAKGDERDVVAGLDAGANDYVAKPFSKEVLLARIRAALRGADGRRAGTVGFDGLSVDDATHTVHLDGRPLSLTLSEYRILGLLASCRGRVFTRPMIIDGISDEQKTVTERTIDVQMVSLRRKLGEWARHVETVRGVGYRIT